MSSYVVKFRFQVVVHTDVPYAPRCRFFPGKAKEMIGAILKEKLTGATYDADTAPMCVREITDAIKAKLKGRAISPILTLRYRKRGHVRKFVQVWT